MSIAGCLVLFTNARNDFGVYARTTLYDLFIFVGLKLRTIQYTGTTDNF